MTGSDMQKAVTDYITESGIRQTHIAGKCHFSKQKMNAIMHLKQAMSLNDYIAICTALNVPFEFFYNRAKERDEAS